MILTIILGLLGLGIVIFIHELGHFIVAKAVHIEVESFALGWGPKLFSMTRGTTEYRINILPIGGYCRMKGEYEFKEAIDKKLASFPYAEGSLFSVSPWQRFLTYAAGPLFNLIFASILFASVWGIGYEFQTFSNRIILASDYPLIYGKEESVSPAEAAGLGTGDTIISLDGKPIAHFKDIQEALLDKADKQLEITYLHDGRTVQGYITPELNRQTGAGVVGIAPWIEPRVTDIPTGSLLLASGLRVGDTITSVDGTQVYCVVDIYQAIFTGRTGTHTYGIVRDGQQVTIEAVTEYDEDGRPIFNAIFPLETVSTPDYGFFGSLGRGVSETFSTFGLAIHSIALMFKGLDLSESMAGPIKITYLVGTATAESFSQGLLTGITTVFRLLGFISTALCFANLLPIPALDGGQMIVSIAEGVLHRGFSPQNYYRLQIIGFGILMTIMAFTIFNDLAFFLR